VDIASGKKIAVFALLVVCFLLVLPTVPDSLDKQLWHPGRTVTDSTGANVFGASVTLKSDGTDAILKTTTGEGGTYSFIDLNPGSYTLTVSQQGFQSSRRSKVDVQIGGFTRVDVNLRLAM